MRAVLGIPAAQDGKPLRLRGHVRTNLGKLHAGNRRVDRPELTANAGRRIRLGIERVMVARPAVRPDQNAVDVLGCRRGLRRLRLQKERERDSETGQSADLQETSAGDPFARSRDAREQVEHGHLLGGWVELAGSSRREPAWQAVSIRGLRKAGKITKAHSIRTDLTNQQISICSWNRRSQIGIMKRIDPTDTEVGTSRGRGLPTAPAADDRPAR